jgi:hypothetical protein
MRRKTSATLVFGIALLIGCSPQSRLVGHYTLMCAEGQIVSDRLILRRDGTFEQHTVLKDGTNYDSRGQKWEYLGNNTLKLDSRKNFSNQTGGIQQPEVLSVELSHPHAILLPNRCYYGGPK